MKHIGRVIQQNRFWLLMLLFVLGMAALFLWMADAQAFWAILSTLILFGVLLFLTVCIACAKKEERRRMAYFTCLEHPTEANKERLKKTAGSLYEDEIETLYEMLNAQEKRCVQAENRMSDYEEYVETWAHEIKTPLSLLTVLLDNRREELPPAVTHRLDVVNARMLGLVNQILYYARLRSGRKDYLFEPLSVRECVDAALADVAPLLEEKQIRVETTFDVETVYSDRRGLLFLMNQILNNAVKYSGAHPLIQIRSYREGDACQVIAVSDNGSGVKSCDLPYIFEKGFTGDSGEKRKSATGMGLYLADRMACDLHLTLAAVSEWQQGFTMAIRFPIVDEKPSGMLNP